MNSYVEILVRNSALNDPTDPVLSGFPLCAGQYFEAEMREAEDDDDDSISTLNLGDADDLTASQEQFLNTSLAVRNYVVNTVVHGIDD